ncbi:MAG: flagellar export chaperone FliS [Planctomycetes bacterium]|nr:flagellar export chaperone FliS [Planctomycetota bacterium]
MVNQNRAYIETQVLTARPEQLTLLLLDGAIRFAEQAKGHIADNNFDGSYQCLSKSEQIVMELLNSLRPENAPELCRQQAGLYLFIYQKLVEANMRRDAERIDEAVRVLQTLRETWIMLIEKLQNECGDERAAMAGYAAEPVSAISLEG